MSLMLRFLWLVLEPPERAPHGSVRVPIDIKTHNISWTLGRPFSLADLRIYKFFIAKIKPFACLKGLGAGGPRAVACGRSSDAVYAFWRG